MDALPRSNGEAPLPLASTATVARVNVSSGLLEEVEGEEEAAAGGFIITSDDEGEEVIAVRKAMGSCNSTNSTAPSSSFMVMV